MFAREFLNSLEKWRHSPYRKPLILRGSRQVGKTSVVHQFGQTFQHYLYFNLEREADKKIFERYNDFNQMVDYLLFAKLVPKSALENTLLFIDEIQETPWLVSQFRYFYEELPALAVIGAGSLLETLFAESQPFPVGRVEYKMLRPATFQEFLGALGEDAALQILQTVPLPDFATDKLFQLFHLYALIGGMPEAVQRFADTRDLSELKPVYESVLTGYKDDIEKYAKSESQKAQLRFVLNVMFSRAGSRVKFEGFGNGPYKSREMGEALRLLEKAFLLRLVYPSTEAKVPMTSDFRKAPKLHVFDTGVMGYANGYQQDLIGTKDLSQHYQGLVVEHLVGQELLATDYSPLHELHFWVRDKNTSSAEVDYLVQYEGMIVPIEVKSGPTGKLKSLMMAVEQFGLKLAIRLHAGPLSQEHMKTPGGHAFLLLNLPYFLVSKWKAYVDWAWRNEYKPN
jgi:predicted AAA+ superfamily ATPase